MDRAESLDRLAAARSGHLATVRPDGMPHVVVATFALTSGFVVTAIDHKPKTGRRLQRLVNLESHPSASFLVDHYDEDWTALWWVRVDGHADVFEEGTLRDEAIVSLSAKYGQYGGQPPEGPVIAIALDRVSSWSSTG